MQEKKKIVTIKVYEETRDDLKLLAAMQKTTQQDLAAKLVSKEKAAALGITAPN